jgi:type IX secretion system PorP/SprF family membrane protein
MNMILKFIKILFFLLSLLVSSRKMYAQEGHFTQFFNAPVYVNPAEAGAEKDIIRVGLNYRRQWVKIASGFTTQALAADMRLGKFGYGVLVSNNNAGASSLVRSNFMFNIARKLMLDSNNILGMGVQVGFANQNFNASQLKFDNQYSNASGYDPNTGNGENFSGNNLTKFDGGFGFTFQNKSYSWKPKISVSFNHFFHPKYAFSEIGNTFSSRQLNTVIEVRKSLLDKLLFVPYVFVSKQRTATNLMLGSRFDYQLNYKQILHFGAAVRNKDALCAYVGATMGKYMLGFSYDANLSKLRPGSKTVGAWELSLCVKFSKPKKHKIEKDSVLVKIDSSVTDMPISVVPEPVDSAGLSKNKIDTARTKPLDKPLVAKAENQEKEKTEKDIDKKVDKVEPVKLSSINPNQIKKRHFVYFDTDKSVIKSEYKILLDGFVEELKNHQNFEVLVSGHTDSDGDGLYNIYLGQARAHEVMKYLVEKGVPVTSIKTFTYGKSSPLFENTQEHLKAKNRRVEVILVNE